MELKDKVEFRLHYEKVLLMAIEELDSNKRCRILRQNEGLLRRDRSLRLTFTESSSEDVDNDDDDQKPSKSERRTQDFCSLKNLFRDSAVWLWGA